MYDPKITSDNYSNGGWSANDASSGGYMRRYTKYISSSPLCVISGAFYSPGAIANISTKYDWYDGIAESFHYLTLDSINNSIDSQYLFQASWDHIRMQKSIYIPRGNHSVMAWVRCVDAGSRYVAVRPNDSLIASSSPGVMAPKISITF
jgi:hypothetical protein